MQILCNFCEIYQKLKDLYKKKQDKLISGQNIKTINYKSILGEGNLDIEGGTSSSQLLGYVNQNTEHLPTTRTDGTPAEKEDYVKPESNATFPFTIDGITFNTRLDRAIYLGDGRWMIDAGVIQQTNETPVSNETLESLTGDATFQSNVNEQFAEIIGKNKTITVDDEETLIDAVNYIWDEVSKLGGKVLKFKGFISNTTPTGTITDGSLWYQDAELPTTFPINVKTYNAETSQWSSTTSTYNPTTFDLWANLNNNNGYYWFGNEWNLIDENVLVDNKTIHKNLEKELELKDGNNIDGVTFQKLNYNLYTEEVVDDDESLPLNSAVYKELLDNTNSKFEYDDSDTEKDLLTITLKNNNRDIIFEKEIDFDDKLVFEKKEQTLTNKTIDADDNEILNLTGENVKDDFMVHDIKASDYHYGFTHNTDNVFTNTTQDGLVNVYSISDEKVITLLGEGTLAGTTLTYDSVAYTRNDTLDDYYIDQSDIKFSSVDMAIFLKKLIDGQKVSFKKVSTFAGELGDLNTLYYLTTSYDNYKKGFYLYNGTVFYQIDYKSVKYVSTFNGIEGDNEALYYLDTDYSTYVKGFYRYVETTTEGVTTGEYVLIGHNQVVYLSTFTGVTGNTEKLYYLDTAYEDYKKGFYRYNGTNFVNINPKHFFIVSTFTGVEGDDEALYYLDTKYDTYKVGFYRFIPAEGGNPDRFVPIGRSLVKYVSTFNGEEGDTDVLYYLDTAYNDYKVGFYRYVEAQGTTPAEFLLIGATSEVFTDVEKLPTEDINANTIYRKATYEYLHNGEELESEPVGYKIADTENISVSATGITIDGTEILWEDLTDTIVSGLVTAERLTETDFTEADFFNYNTTLFDIASNFEREITYTLYYNPTAIADKYIQIDGDGVVIDNKAIIKNSSNELQANAIIDVDTFPTTDIKEKSLYRKEVQHFYNVEGEEMTPINIYNAVEEMGVLVDLGGIQIGEDITPWSSITDTWVREYVTNGYFVESDKAINNGDSFIKLAADSYAFINRLVNTKVLYYRDNNTWKEVGSGGGNSDVDEVTTEIVNDKLQANAIVRINTLPTDNIKPNSFYGITETVSYEFEEWTYNGNKIDVTPTCYESLSQEVEVTVGGITYNEVIPWNEVTQELIDELVSNNLVGVCEFPQASFCGFNGQFDHESKFTYTIEQKSFSMVKTFKWDNNSWTSITTIALTNEEYNQLSVEQKMDGTIYIIDDLTPVVVENSYNTLADKPVVNGIMLQGSLTLEDLGLYSRSEVNALLENKGQVEFVDALPATPTTNTWYYSKKYKDGTDVPDDKRCLYIVDEDPTVFHEMGIVGDIEMETGDTLSGSEHLVTSSQVVKKEMSTKLNKYGTQVNIESAVDDATLWTSLAQIGTDDKKTDLSMVFNAGTCYLISSVSPTKTAQIFQFIVTGSVGASAINKRITLINPLTNEMFTKVMDGGTWQAWKGGKRYKHTLVRYNTDDFKYPMGWVSIISNKKTMSVDDFKTWLNEKGYTTATNSYYWCGGCCGTTEVRNSADTGKAYVGKVASGVYYDGTNLFFKWDFNGTTQINPARCKIVTEELN